MSPRSRGSAVPSTAALWWGLVLDPSPPGSRQVHDRLVRRQWAGGADPGDGTVVVDGKLDESRWPQGGAAAHAQSNRSVLSTPCCSATRHEEADGAGGPTVTVAQEALHSSGTAYGERAQGEELIAGRTGRIL